MAFVWKGDSLYTKRGKVPDASVSEWTSFFMAMREPMDLPKPADFGRFLATSMAFTSNIRQIEVFVDESRILQFQKKVSPPKALSFSKNEYTLYSPNRFFTLQSVAIRNVQIDVNFKETKSNLFGPAKDQILECTVFMKIASGSLSVSLPRSIEKDMERTTKKSPPKTTEMSIIYSSFDEHEGSLTTSAKTNIFEDLLLSPGDQGRIFIGFPTHQTTGCSIHLAAHLIPTVERENIDFVDKTLGAWNQEMLSMGGLLGRIVCEDDLETVARLYSEMKLDETSEVWLRKKGTHNLQSFTFQNSTPAGVVGRLIATHFYQLTSKPIRLITTKGIIPVQDSRIQDPTMAEFIKEIPIIPEETSLKCKDLLKRLVELKVLHTVSIEDVFVELGKRPLPAKEAVALFQWWIGQWRIKAISNEHAKRLQQCLVILEDSGPQPMTIIKYHAAPKLVPPDLSIPSSVLPLDVSKFFIKPELEQAFW